MKTSVITAVSLFVISVLTVFALASETYVPPPESIKPPRVTVQSIYAQKCSRCHAISRPDTANKTPSQWKDTVERMRSKDTGWISRDEADKITMFLSGRNLTASKCSKCHPDSRADVNKTVPQWQTTLDRMQSKDLEWLSDQEKDLIKFYLTDVFLLELD